MSQKLISPKRAKERRIFKSAFMLTEVHDHGFEKLLY